ncbi:hypothetical protein C8Q80DRAFT_597370 [Daedaleopsis nitida]|nr:hypothetical protein C8Q80DRAFT_597370 [Daedaleopsis nitida]
MAQAPAPAQAVVTRPNTSFSIPFGCPPSPVSSPSTTLSSPAPRSPAQLRRPSHPASAHSSPQTVAQSVPVEYAREDKQTELVEALKRSVTIVFWYKP